MIFLGLLIIPVLILAIAYRFSGGGITPKEAAGQFVVSAVIAGLSMVIIFHHNTSDVEILNGRVTGKSRSEVSCGHPYCCVFTTYRYKCGKYLCTGTRCGAWCHRHTFDVNWSVQTSLGAYNIDRLSSQGLEEPPRWSEANVADPVAQSHDYENFIKAVPGDFFQHDVDEEALNIPDYPEHITDYYKLNRVVVQGVDLDPPLPQWNRALSELNADLGLKKDVNVVVLITTGRDERWYEQLRRSWVGGKINDVVLVINTEQGSSHIGWVKVMGWFKNPEFATELEDEIMASPSLALDPLMLTIHRHVTDNFKHRNLADFAYLKSKMTPTVNQWLISILIGSLLAIGLAVAAHRNDFFD